MRMGVWIVTAVLVAACSGGGDSGDAGAKTADDEGVFDPMVGTMDRAAGVEDLSSSRKEEMDRAVEEQER